MSCICYINLENKGSDRLLGACCGIRKGLNKFGKGQHSSLKPNQSTNYISLDRKKVNSDFCTLFVKIGLKLMELFVL